MGASPPSRTTAASSRRSIIGTPAARTARSSISTPRNDQSADSSDVIPAENSPEGSRWGSNRRIDGTKRRIEDDGASIGSIAVSSRASD
jgi:hypothetical protein